MSDTKLTDEQWIVLDLLMRAKEKGQPFLTRQELMAPPLPQAAVLRLTFAALTMPTELAEWRGHNVLYITDRGVSTYKTRFGKKASAVADSIIYLPGPEPHA